MDGEREQQKERLKRVLDVNSILGIKNIKFITGLKKKNQTSG